MKKAISILLVVLCIAMFAAFALGSGEDDSSVSSGEGGTEASQTQSNESLTAKVGDTLTTSDLKITYVSCSEYKDYNEFVPPKEGNKIIKLTFDVENISDIDRYISYYDFSCYADNVAADAYYSVDDDLAATVSPGRKATGSVYFEVPKNAETIEVEYETDFWTGNKAIFVVQ